jgi:hypothetical protein
MGKIISYVSDNVYVYYSKITTMCSRKKIKKSGSNFNETPNESLLSDNLQEESSDDIKINLVVDKPKDDPKKLNLIKNEYLLLKNTDDYDYKRNDIDIESLSKEINEIKLAVDENSMKSKIQNMDIDSMDDLKRQIFDKNEFN